MELVLQILSTTGYVLLIILAVIALLIALVLFLPVVYSVKVKKKDGFDAAGNVRWLFGAVWFSFSFDKGGLNWNLRIFGYPVGKKLQSKRKVVKAKKAEYAPAKKQPTIKPGERVDESSGPSRTGINRLKENEAFEEKAKPSFTEKIRFTFKNICDKLKKAKELKAVFDKAKPVLAKLLKAVLPKKISGYIDFGFDDPATTGIFIGVISALCIPIPEGLKVTPYFNEKKFECDVKIAGRIFIIVLLINIVRLFKIPEIRKLLKDALPAKKGRKNKYKKKQNRRR